METETKPVLPTNFILDLQEKITDELGMIAQALEMPEIKQAVDQAIYLQILADMEPDKFKPGGAAGHERETLDAVIQGAWLLESLGELRAKTVRTSNDRKDQA